MTSNFVRYSPEIETFDPKLSEYMTRIIDFWETKVRQSPTREGSGRAVRGAHAKTLASSGPMSTGTRLAGCGRRCGTPSR